MAKRREIIDGKHQCFACKEWKPVSEFYTDKISYTGLRGRCKKCDLEKVNNHHTDSLDRALKNILVRHRSNGRNGSKRRQVFTVDGDLTLFLLHKMWREQDGKCAVTGVKLTHIQGQGFRIWTNVTVDRINPDIGYQEDNIRLVCRAVNYMKAAMTDVEMVEWAGRILNGPMNKPH